MKKTLRRLFLYPNLGKEVVSLAMRIHSKFGYCSVEETKMDARLEKWLKQEKAKKKK